MPHGDPLAHVHAKLLLHPMQYAAVLDIGIRPNADREYISAHHRIHPHAGIFPEHDVANDLRRFIHVTARGYFRAHAFVGANHRGEAHEHTMKSGLLTTEDTET